jgi:two-component system, response regulator YesN
MGNYVLHELSYVPAVQSQQDVQKGKGNRMKFNILVADDEYMIRRGIIKLLHKYSEFDVVEEAEDGEQALELARQREYDVFFVDINMPFLNGLQFIEKLREVRPKAIVSVITGYDKFEYVRQALHLGVFEYILKPLNEEAFYTTVEKIIAALKEKNREEKYLHWAKINYDRNRSNFNGEFLDKCIMLQYSAEKVKEEIEFYGFDFPEHYTVTLICLEKIENPDIRKQWNDGLLYSSAENIARETYERLTPLLIGRNSKGYLILICKAAAKSIMDSMNQDYKNAVEKYIPAKVLLAQQSEEDCARAPFVYKELMEKLEEIKSYPSIIKKIKQYIENYYYKEELSLVDAAAHVSLSPQHLSRIFKKEMDITFIDYLTNYRIGKAIELFTDDSIKMYEIAERVGYNSQHYFSSVFKKVIGISPVEYRCQFKNKKAENLYELM